MLKNRVVGMVNEVCLLQPKIPQTPRESKTQPVVNHNTANNKLYYNHNNSQKRTILSIKEVSLIKYQIVLPVLRTETKDKTVMMMMMMNALHIVCTVTLF